jgi:hypothetical protein
MDLHGWLESKLNPRLQNTMPPGLFSTGRSSGETSNADDIARLLPYIRHAWLPVLDAAWDEMTEGSSQILPSDSTFPRDQIISAVGWLFFGAPDQRRNYRPIVFSTASSVGLRPRNGLRMHDDQYGVVLFKCKRPSVTSLD